MPMRRSERCRFEPGQDAERKIRGNTLMEGVLVISGCLSSASLVKAADVAAGKAKATEICAGCHGENGISQMENIPSLAGQLDQYIQWQLVYFRSGSRKNEQMQPI